jgi:molybdate transport system substrate-binding protein
MNRTLGLVVVMFLLSGLAGCYQEPTELVVYAGKGLKVPVEVLKQQFEQREGVPVRVVYAGSKTLLDTIRKTRKGDIYIPGSSAYLKQAGKLVDRAETIGWHVPVFAVAAAKQETLRSYADLLKPGVRIAIGNRQMTAIGRLAEAMMSSAPDGQSFRHNVVVNASTVNELLDLVIAGQVDAALVWRDMLQWDKAAKLSQIVLPEPMTATKEIPVVLLSTRLQADEAERFYEFVRTQGKVVFEQHGFNR